MINRNIKYQDRPSDRQYFYAKYLAEKLKIQLPKEKTATSYTKFIIKCKKAIQDKGGLCQ